MTRVDGFELNICCPNVDAGGMAFGTTCARRARRSRARCARSPRKPLIVKLTPNVTDIAEIARAVEAAGADAVSLINTLLGMAIDTRTFRPKLARVVGGLSGPGDQAGRAADGVAGGAARSRAGRRHGRAS